MCFVLRAPETRLMTVSELGVIFNSVSQSSIYEVKRNVDERSLDARKPVASRLPYFMGNCLYSLLMCHSRILCLVHRMEANVRPFSKLLPHSFHEIVAVPVRFGRLAKLATETVSQRAEFAHLLGRSAFIVRGTFVGFLHSTGPSFRIGVSPPFLVMESYTPLVVWLGYRSGYC